MRVIEGVYDGVNMVTDNKMAYPIGANYASKSKLVTGDLLKLTINDSGQFIYKQVQPVARKSLIGTVRLDPGDQQWHVDTGKKSYKVMKTSVTYFKAREGDEAVIIIPSEGETEWAALDNVIKNQDIDQEL